MAGGYGGYRHILKKGTWIKGGFGEVTRAKGDRLHTWHLLASGLHHWEWRDHEDSTKSLKPGNDWRLP
ncbi:MAG: hypothetical protein NTAFB09_01540 [Nitrosospira sp.]